MRFPGIRLVEQTKQNFVAYESVPEKRVIVIVRLFYSKSDDLKRLVDTDYETG